jgi:hypothetical protein
MNFKDIKRCLQRQVSYFGDQEGIDGLLKYLRADDINFQVLQMLWGDSF